MTRTNVPARLNKYGMPIGIALCAAVYVLLRANYTTTPDGDPALHLRLIKDIAATGELPTQLPNFPARVESGGEVVAMFPYSYPPLYHALGAVVYKVGGLAGVLGLNALSAAIIALSIYAFTSRRMPRLAAAAVSLVFLTSPVVIAPFRSPFMEPLMLALIFAGAWVAYVASATRRPLLAGFSGVLLGLGLATRQNALFACFAIGLVLAWGLAERGAWRPSRARRETAWIAALACGGLLIAGPALAYLTVVSGGIGYADNWLPGMSPSLAVDPVANSYIANITKPGGPMIEWVANYRRTLIYTESWSAEWSSLLVVASFLIGTWHLYGRAGASRFFARWSIVQVAVDAAMFVTLHGNARYIIVSQILFHTTAAVGVFAALAYAIRWLSAGSRARQLVGAAAAAVAIVSIATVLTPHNSQEVDSFLRTQDRQLRSFRGAEYAEMATWINENTQSDALILTPRTYTALLTWERNVTWVTFYGNAWVVDAIQTSEPRRANEILNAYGVDYVLIPDPPGSYIDAIPADGMRSYLQLSRPPTEYFELIHATTNDGAFISGSRQIEHGLRLYEVKAMEQASHEAP